MAKTASHQTARPGATAAEVAKVENEVPVNRKAACQILGIGRTTLDRLVASGELPYIQYTEHGKRLFLRSDLIAFRDQHRRQGPSADDVADVVDEMLNQ
jgi:excisionase family DNA binding protein